MVVRWVLETGVFGPGYALPAAAAFAGHRVTVWHDSWWSNGAWPSGHDEAVIFHGSLGNAARVAAELPWRPGAFCDVDAYRCSSWYPRAAKWLLHTGWQIMPADQLVAQPPHGAAQVFVRPDSPLKPFSGRVLDTAKITLAALDHGFYYDDRSLPVVVAPVRSVTREWRFVVVNRRVISGSEYLAEGRAAVEGGIDGSAWAFATTVAEEMEPPQEVYVLDVCEADGELHLLELNPFSGADLYACDANVVVREISDFATRDIC